MNIRRSGAVPLDGCLGLTSYAATDAQEAIVLFGKVITV